MICVGRRRRRRHFCRRRHASDQHSSTYRLSLRSGPSDHVPSLSSIARTARRESPAAHSFLSVVRSPLSTSPASVSSVCVNLAGTGTIRPRRSVCSRRPMPAASPHPLHSPLTHTRSPHARCRRFRDSSSSR
jgi:hypothetical protein